MDDITLLTGIRERILPLTIALVILAVGYYTFNKMPPGGTPWDIAEWIIRLIAFIILFSIFPVVTILFGWYTGNRAGAVLIGIIGLPLAFICGSILLRPGNMVFHPHSSTLPYITVLTAACALAGYCAAQKTKKYLAISVVLTGLWLVIWMSGFN